MVMPAYGDVVLVAGGTYSGKPRPVLVFQSSQINTGESVIVIPFTTTNNTAIQPRVAVTPSQLNGLQKPCFLEIDKLSAINAAFIGKSVGMLEQEYLERAKDAARLLLQL